MNTSDPQQIALTKEEAESIKERFKDEKRLCAENAIRNNTKDIESIDEILPILQQEDVSPDELVMPLHNLISVAPDQQYRFYPYIKKLYMAMPVMMNFDTEFRRVKEKLLAKKDTDLHSKLQTTDLSIYWSAYRSFVYKNGLIEKSKQIKAQEELRQEMLKVAVNTVARRTVGIESAKKLLNDGVQLERTGDDHSGEPTA